MNSRTIFSQGLFGRVENATIENLGIEGVNIKCNSRVGGVVGFLKNGSVNNCYVTSTIVTDGSQVGGIAGYVEDGGSISNCYSAGTIDGQGNYVGGIAGQIVNSSVAHCYSTGSTTNASCGVVGFLKSGSSVTNCAALNTSVDNYRVGWLFEGTASNNIAFEEMLNKDGNTTWSDKGENRSDGADITIEEIHADGTLGGRFTSEDGWTTEDGKLPGLFGKTVDMPPHLSIIPVAPVITTTSLPDGTEGTAYNQTLTATGTATIEWEIIEGSLPDGLNLSGATISGTPTVVGTFEFTVKAIPETGYRFVNWTQGEETVTDNPYTFAVTDDVELIANFEQLTGVVVETRHATSLQVYPNPTSGQLIINNEQLIMNN